MKKVLKLKRTHKEAILPDYAHVGDAGLDLYSVEDLIIPPQKRSAVHTGIEIAEMPHNSKITICAKSGLALKNGIIILGGIVDENYRGELVVIMHNSDDKPYQVEKGKKIAQILVSPVIYCKVVESNHIKNTSRGNSGFGSTGLDKNK